MFVFYFYRKLLLILCKEIKINFYKIIKIDKFNYEGSLFKKFQRNEKQLPEILIKYLRVIV